MKPELFKADMAIAIRVVIADCRREGTTGMSADCLWQIVAMHLNRQHGPTGTNAAWVARQTFNELIERPPFSRFVTD